MKSIDQKQDPAVDAINTRLKGIRFKATAGPHKVAVAFVHRTFAESDDKLYQQQPGGGQDRVLKALVVRSEGAVLGHAASARRRAARRSSAATPKSPAEEGPCAQKIIDAARAHGVPSRPDGRGEGRSSSASTRPGRKADGNFDGGVRRALTAILASPYFLYRAEPAPQTREPGSIYAINDMEFASRLSFFLWSTVPDEELRKVAASGTLRQPEVLRAQVKRMLADPRSQTLASSFAFQWLNIGKLAEIDPDANIFPYAGDPRADFRTELRMFIDSVFREDRSVHRPARRELHVPERAPRAALRHPQRARRPVAPRRARGHASAGACWARAVS